MKTKELYSVIIDIQKKTGQGLSGVVTINQPSIRISMNNLIERGLIIKESSGSSSIGHPASNDWYMPSTGYNVWKEIREYGNLMPLFFIRKFLGDNEHASYVDENEYNRWLEKNKEEIDTMLGISPILDIEEVFLFDEESMSLVKKYWEMTVSDAIRKLEEVISILSELIRLRKLYKPNEKDYQKIIDEMKREEREKDLLEKICNFLCTQPGDSIMKELDWKI